METSPTKYMTVGSENPPMNWENERLFDLQVS